MRKIPRAAPLQRKFGMAEMFGVRGCLLLFTLNYNIGGGNPNEKRETIGACKQSWPRVGLGLLSSTGEGDVSARSLHGPAFPLLDTISLNLSELGWVFFPLTKNEPDGVFPTFST